MYLKIGFLSSDALLFSNKLFSGNLHIFLYNLIEEPRSNLFAAVMRNCCPSTIRMLEDHMASGGMAVGETKSLNNFGNFFSG